MQTPELKKPWEQLSELVGRDDPEQINDFLNSINPADTALLPTSGKAIHFWVWWSAVLWRLIPSLPFASAA